MITATISDAKERLSELLAEVKAGESLIITDLETPVARVERISPTADNPKIIVPREKKWNAWTILRHPIMAANAKSVSLVETVNVERDSGW